MKEYIYGRDTVIVEDDTTIYEIDLNCYRSLPEKEREAYFPVAVRMAVEGINRK